MFQWIVFGPAGLIGIHVLKPVAMVQKCEQDQKLCRKKMVGPALVKLVIPRHAR